MNLRDGIFFKDLYGSCFEKTVSKQEKGSDQVNSEKEEAPRWSLFKDIFTKQEIDLLIDHNYARTLEFDIIKQYALEEEPLEVTEVMECNNNISTAFDNEGESILKAYLLNMNTTEPEGLKIINLNSEHDIRCIVCDKTFEDQQLLSWHLKTHNEDLKMSRFTQCNELLEEKIPSADLKFDLLERFKCSQCCKEFKQRKHLNDHVRRIHYKEKLFKCRNCDEPFYSKYYLKKHLNSSHGENYQDTKKDKKKTFSCEFCLKAFLYKYELIRHTLCHGPKQFRCEICDKEFAYERSLKAHVVRHSDNEKGKIECEDLRGKIIREKVKRKRVRNRKKELSVQEKLKALKQFLGE